MNKFVLKGGNINEFLDTVAVQKSAGINDRMDLADEANQELIVRQGLSDEGYDIEFLDGDENPKLASEYNIRSVPTTVIEVDGKEVDRIIGVKSKTEMIKVLS